MFSGRDFLATTLLAPIGAPAQTRKPNIVLLVADDLGFAEIAVQGCEDSHAVEVGEGAEGTLQRSTPSLV